MWTVAEGSRGEFLGEGGLEELPTKLRGVVERMEGDERWCIYVGLELGHGGSSQGAKLGCQTWNGEILEPVRGWRTQGLEWNVEDEGKGRLPCSLCKGARRG